MEYISIIGPIFCGCFLIIVLLISTASKWATIILAIIFGINIGLCIAQLL